jgi:serine/threonine-protein kinase
MTTASVTDFVAVLRNSQLLDPPQLQEIERDCSEYREPKALIQRLVQRGCLTAYQVEQLLRPDGQELIIGPYRLLDLLGEGGMGQVFRAIHMHLQRVVALKVIHPGRLTNDPEAVKRFQREARAAALMVHPNVVMVYDADQVGETSYIALEYVEGVDLARLLKEKGRLPVAQACEYTRQAALGLQHAHEHGIIHRDIKPSNLLVMHRPDPRKGISALHARPGGVGVSVPTPLPRGQGTMAIIKILDMGLVRLVQGEGGNTQLSLTQEGTVMGTPDYIAPEQARNAHRVDIRADIYSLGCTLYHLLAGRMPFPEGTVIEKLLMHQLDAPKPLEEIRPELPPGVVLVVNKMMAKRREDRYQVPAEVAEVLSRYSTEAPAIYSRPTVPLRKPMATPAPVRRPAPPREPTPAAKTDLSACGKTAQVTVVVAPAGVETPPPAERPTPEFLVSFTGHGSGVQATAFTRDRDTLATGGLDGTVRIWDFSGAQPRERAVLAARRPAVAPTPARAVPGIGAPTLTSNPAPAIHSVAFAPNNRLLASGGGMDGLIRLWDVSAEVPVERAVFNGHKAPVDALTFAPDSKLLASGGNDRTIRLWDVTTAPARERGVLRGHDDFIKALAFSPDGRLLASAGQDATIRLWNTQTRVWAREQAALPGHGGHVTTLAFSPDGKLLASGSQDQSVLLWDVSTPKPAVRAALTGHTGIVRLVLFIPGGQILISVDDGGQVMQWDVSSAQKVRGWILPRTLLCSVALTFDGRYLATGTTDGKVRIFRLGTKRRKESGNEASGVA